jgi:hypothetical protein
MFIDNFSDFAGRRIGGKAFGISKLNIPKTRSDNWSPPGQTFSKPKPTPFVQSVLVSSGVPAIVEKPKSKASWATKRPFNFGGKRLGVYKDNGFGTYELQGFINPSKYRKQYKNVIQSWR